MPSGNGGAEAGKLLVRVCALTCGESVEENITILPLSPHLAGIYHVYNYSRIVPVVDIV